MYRTEISVIFDDRSHLLSLNTYLYPPPHARETRIQQELLSPVGLYLSHVNFTRPVRARHRKFIFRRTGNDRRLKAIHLLLGQCRRAPCLLA